MAEPLAVRCAAASLDRDEPLHGTASRVQRWMVVEQPGAWGREAVLESKLDRDVAARLQADADRHRVRVVLARRTDRRRDHRLRRVYLAHSGAERRWIEQVDLPAGDAAAVLSVDLATTAFPEPPGLGAPGPPALFLVCTNGRHDPCCADLGRPVVRALVAAGAPDVWECSHIGGDRFAANVVSLPDGVYYGRVDPAGAAALLAGHRDGVVALDHYRGRSCHPPLVQAAELFARRHLGERRLDGMGVLSAERGGDGTVVVLVQQRGGEALEVVVQRERAPATQLTCHVQEPRRPWSYRLVALGPA
ncbi:MAG TPA: sucrase ferredoxin [Acidimicrobiales bacterium]|nr:sucrase ferredoxin [Acidimicrobiales bacterium]